MRLYWIVSLTAVYGHLPRTPPSKEWLEVVLWAAIREHDQVWMDKDHRPEQAAGLSRYYGMGKGQPPEVEPGHFDAVYERYLVDRSRLANLARVLRMRWWIQRSVRQLEERYKAGRFVAQARARRGTGFDRHRSQPDLREPRATNLPADSRGVLGRAHAAHRWREPGREHA